MKYFLGRQPIFSRSLDVFGYELLYRSSATGEDAVQASAVAQCSSVLSAVLADGGMKDLVGERFAFINFSEDLLNGSVPLPVSFGINRIVVEVLEDVPDTPEIRAGLRDLRSRGYLIALDDFVPGGPQAELVGFADIIKLDVQALGLDAVSAATEELKSKRLRVLAEKVETEAEYEACAEFGADYFQGYFLERPALVPVSSIAPSGLSVLQLLSELRRSDVTLAEVESHVGRDVSLAYKVLRHVNSSFYGLRCEVESIGAAVNYLGLNRIRDIASLMALSSIDTRPALVDVAMQRARMCELIALQSGAQGADRFFTVGLFSCLDALLGAPLEDLVGELPLSADVVAGLLERKGELGMALDCATAYEDGEWERVRHPALGASELNHCFVEAARWVSQVGGGSSTPTQAA
jgi:EAL and modified HD-GYP domain-containing signal transduction protein